MTRRQREQGIPIIVLTGGPCAGKSALIAKLPPLIEARLGWHAITIPETVAWMGNNGMRREDFPDVATFQSMQTRIQVSHEDDAMQAELENIYRNAGFYYYKASLATYKADPFAVPYKVQLRLEPKANLPGFFYKRYYMGHTYINVYRHAGDTLSNSMTRRTVTVNYSGRKPPLYPLVFLQNIAHRPRRLYRQRDEARTQEMLAGLGIFNQINVSYARRDTTQTCDTREAAVALNLREIAGTCLEAPVWEPII